MSESRIRMLFVNNVRYAFGVRRPAVALSHTRDLLSSPVTKRQQAVALQSISDILELTNQLFSLGVLP
jgi:hypothetical protein